MLEGRCPEGPPGKVSGKSSAGGHQGVTFSVARKPPFIAAIHTRKEAPRFPCGASRHTFVF